MIVRNLKKATLHFNVTKLPTYHLSRRCTVLVDTYHMKQEREKYVRRDGGDTEEKKRERRAESVRGDVKRDLN